MIVVCISDTHTLHEEIEVPDGDVLIVAGDFTGTGKEIEIIRFARWLTWLPHKYKIIIAGNHDKLFETNREHALHLLGDSCIYLQDSSVTINGINFYGTPWTLRYYDWSFMKEEWSLAEVFRKIPGDTDVLITHCPPFQVLDSTYKTGRIGSESLLEKICIMNLFGRPRYHIFGHNHGGHGFIKKDCTTFINAAICNDDYDPINEPIVFEI